MKFDPNLLGHHVLNWLLKKNSDLGYEQERIEIIEGVPWLSYSVCHGAHPAATKLSRWIQRADTEHPHENNKWYTRLFQLMLDPMNYGSRLTLAQLKLPEYSPIWLHEHDGHLRIGIENGPDAGEILFEMPAPYGIPISLIWNFNFAEGLEVSIDGLTVLKYDGLIGLPDQPPCVFQRGCYPRKHEEPFKPVKVYYRGDRLWS